jgi:hypothetical protein
MQFTWARGEGQKFDATAPRGAAAPRTSNVARIWVQAQDLLIETCGRKAQAARSVERVDRLSLVRRPKAGKNRIGERPRNAGDAFT